MKAREALPPFAIVGVILFLSYWLHTQWCSTPFNLPESEWQFMVDSHHFSYPFSIRPLTTQCTLALHNLFGWSLKESFGIIQFTLMALLGMFFYRFLRRVGLLVPWAELGLASLMLSYPLFFAVSEPTHTWDDIWGYLFLTLCAEAVVNRRFYWGACWFLLGCVAREQTLIYYPVFAGGVLFLSGLANWRKTLVPLLIPVVLYGAYFAIVWQPPAPERFRLLMTNFDGFLRSRDSLYSIFMAFGWLWAGWILALVLVGRKRSSPHESHILKWGTVYAVPVTVVFTLLFTLVRETRVLFPPMILVVPFVLLTLQANARDIAEILKQRKALWIAVATLVFCAGLMAGPAIFPVFEYRACPVFSKAWASLQIGVSLVLLTVAGIPLMIRRNLFR
jgi:hypothetical protein